MSPQYFQQGGRILVIKYLANILTFRWLYAIKGLDIQTTKVAHRQTLLAYIFKFPETTFIFTNSVNTCMKFLL